MSISTPATQCMNEIIRETKVRDECKIREMLAHIEADDRLSYSPALVQVNAPLALIQVDLQARADVLKWVLGESNCGAGSAGEPVTKRE